MRAMRNALALVGADAGNVVRLLAGGWSLFAAVHVLTVAYLVCPGCPEGTGDHHVTLRLQLVWLLYAMAPWAFGVLDMHRRTAVWTMLPLSRRGLNAALLVRGGVLFVCCLPAWGFLVWRARDFGMPLHPWLAVCTALALLLYHLLGMVTGVGVRAAVLAVVPLLLFPAHGQVWIRNALAAAATPWPSLALAVLAAAVLPRVLAVPLPPPRRSPR